MNKMILLIIMFVSMQCIANRVESWNMIQATKKIDRFSIGLSEEMRIGVDQSQTTKKIDELHTTASIDFIGIDHLAIGVQDDYVLLRDKTDVRYKRDNRPGVNVSLYDSFYGFKVMNRSRFVYRDIEDERPYFRYRNLSKVYSPSLFHSTHANDVKPFVGFEWYFDEGSKDRKIRKNDKFCQFWLDAGIQAKITEFITVEMFYRLIEAKSFANHAWNPGHAICMTATLSF